MTPACVQMCFFPLVLFVTQFSLVSGSCSAAVFISVNYPLLSCGAMCHLWYTWTHQLLLLIRLEIHTILHEPSSLHTGALTNQKESPVQQHEHDPSLASHPETMMNEFRHVRLSMMSRHMVKPSVVAGRCFLPDSRPGALWWCRRYRTSPLCCPHRCNTSSICSPSPTTRSDWLKNRT